MSRPDVVEVDQAADALYVYLGDAPVASTQDFGDLCNVDYDVENQVVGVELIGIAGGISLSGVPEARRVEAALLAHGLGDRIVEARPSGPN